VLAIDSVSGNICTRLQEKILSKIPDDASKTMGLQKILNLGKGPPYELCLNIDVSDGLANGTPCIIKMFDYRVENSNRCSIIWVEFEDVKTGMHWRKKYCNLYRRNISVGWTPIFETTRNFTFSTTRPTLLFEGNFLFKCRQVKLYIRHRGQLYMEQLYILEREKTTTSIMLALVELKI
jgi:hypothetical protein